MNKTAMKLLLGPLLALFCAGASLAGCNAVDCHHICVRYKDCFESNYDTSSCEQRCRDKSGNDDSYAHKVDLCEVCLDDQSCATATFQCAVACSSVVP